MGDLTSLIRLNKHELDEKRQALGLLYHALAELERRIRDIDHQVRTEKETLAGSGEVHFTFVSFLERALQEKQDLEKKIAALHVEISAAKDSMMETFAELKKYEMTQEERDRLEKEERAFRDQQELDAIGIEIFRRRREEE